MRWSGSITGLRAAASVAVLLFHISYIDAQRGGTGVLQVLRLGWVGVDLFFVLSGFLLGRILIDRVGPGSVLRFWRDRALRIVPAYWVSLVLALVMAGNLALVVKRPDVFALHLLYLHNWFPAIANDITPIYWSLAVEAQFYLLLPLAMPALRSRFWPLLCAAALAFSIVWRHALYPDPNLYFTIATLPAFFGHFAIGLAVARLDLQADWRSWRALRWGGVAILAVALWTIGTADYVQAWHGRLENAIARPILAVGFALLIASLRGEHGLLARLLSNRAMQAAGNASYSLYLTHVPVLVLLALLATALGWSPWVFALAGVAASLAFAFLFHAIVERPVLGIRQRWRARQVAPIVPDTSGPR